MAVSSLTPSCSNMNVVLGRLRRFCVSLVIFLIPSLLVFFLASSSAITEPFSFPLSSFGLLRFAFKLSLASAT